jgi:hypothetical protein
MTERRLFQGRTRPSDRVLGFGISGSRDLPLFVGQITRMAHSVWMRCGTSQSSEITFDWDTLVTGRTEEGARLLPQSERRAV